VNNSSKEFLKYWTGIQKAINILRGQLEGVIESGSQAGFDV